MYYNQELGLCIEFGPVRVDSVRRGGGPLDQHGLLPGLLVIACYLSFTPSSLKFLSARYSINNFIPPSQPRVAVANLIVSLCILFL